MGEVYFWINKIEVEFMLRRAGGRPPLPKSSFHDRGVRSIRDMLFRESLFLDSNDAQVLVKIFRLRAKGPRKHRLQCSDPLDLDCGAEGEP